MELVPRYLKFPGCGDLELEAEFPTTLKEGAGVLRSQIARIECL
jgi:hypothetical protein